MSTQSDRAASGPARLLDATAQGMHILGAVLIAFLALVFVVDVGRRVFMDAPIAGVPEFAGMTLVIITALQLPYVVLSGYLLRVTFITEALPPGAVRVLETLTWGIGTILFAVLVLYSWGPMLDGYRTNEFVGSFTAPIPAWPMRIGTLILWGVCTIVCLWLTLRAASGHRPHPVDDDRLEH